jgi:hypothetical protein
MLEGETGSGAHLKIDALAWPKFLENVKRAANCESRHQVRHAGQLP